MAAMEKAMELARAQGQTALTDQLESWLITYRAKQPNAPAQPNPALPP